MSFQIDVTVNRRDLDRLDKQLSKWQGQPLAKRLDKALAAGARIFQAAIKRTAPRLTGGLQRSTKVRRIRARTDQVAAYQVMPDKRVPDKGSSALLTALLVYGTKRGVEATPFVDTAVDATKATVSNFIEYQVKRLS